LKTKPEKHQGVIDLTIVGAGPTGLSAAVNAASEGLNTVVIDSEHGVGGQAKFSSRIANYLGFPTGLSGPQLMSRAYSQSKKFGAEFELGVSVVGLGVEGKFRTLKLSDGRELVSRTVLFATGLQWRILDAEGAQEYSGRGVFYGANPTDGPNESGRQVFIIGAANSAGQAAVNLAKFAAKVTLVNPSPKLDKMSQYLIDEIEGFNNISVLFEHHVAAVLGDGSKVTGIKLVNGDNVDYPADSVYVFIGAEPRTLWLKTVCELDEHGYIVTNADFATSCSGVFAAGDVRSGSTKRIASGVGEGGGAVAAIHRYLAR
jgi:thioredoxin reductase (NADPH)